MNGNTRALQIGDTVVIRCFSADRWPTWGLRGRVEQIYPSVHSYIKDGTYDTYTPVNVKFFDPRGSGEETITMRADELVLWNGLDEILSFT